MDNFYKNQIAKFSNTGYSFRLPSTKNSIGCLQWRHVGLRSRGAANSNHIMQVNRFNFTRLLVNHFVHHVISKRLMCDIIDFFLTEEA